MPGDIRVWKTEVPRVRLKMKIESSQQADCIAKDKA